VVAEVAATCHALHPASSALPYDALEFTPTHPQHVVAEVAAARHVMQLLQYAWLIALAEQQLEADEAGGNAPRLVRICNTMACSVQLVVKRAG
jgi:hypothetical protein